MDTSVEYRRIALIMVAGFVATVGTLYWRDHRAVPEPVNFAADVQAPQRSAQAAAQPAISAAASSVFSRASPVSAPADRPRAKAPLPPSVQPSLPSLAATPDVPETPPKSPELEFFVNPHLQQGRVRVRLFNHSDAPIDGAVRIMRSERLVGERRFEVQPNHQVTLGVDDGLEILSGDRVVLQPDSGSSVIEKDV